MSGYDPVFQCDWLRDNAQENMGAWHEQTVRNFSISGFPGSVFFRIVCWSHSGSARKIFICSLLMEWKSYWSVNSFSNSMNASRICWQERIDFTGEVTILFGDLTCARNCLQVSHKATGLAGQWIPLWYRWWSGDGHFLQLQKVNTLLLPPE